MIVYMTMILYTIPIVNSFAPEMALFDLFSNGLFHYLCDFFIRILGRRWQVKIFISSTSSRFYLSSFIFDYIFINADLVIK